MSRNGGYCATAFDGCSTAGSAGHHWTKPRRLGDKALAKVMGLKGAAYIMPKFPTIIPALGTKFGDRPLLPSRSGESNRSAMVSYLNVGSAWGVTAAARELRHLQPAARPSPFEAGTAQETYAEELSKQCKADGKEDHRHAARAGRYRHEDHQRCTTPPWPIRP